MLRTIVEIVTAVMWCVGVIVFAIMILFLLARAN
jgi:hypothetical protein